MPPWMDVPSITPLLTPILPPPQDPAPTVKLSFAERSFLSLEAFLACSVAVCCVGLVLLAALALLDEHARHDLFAFAKAAHENWRVSLIFLFPIVRVAWHRIEPRIKEIAGVKLDPAPSTVGMQHTPIGGNNTGGV